MNRRRASQLGMIINRGSICFLYSVKPRIARVFGCQEIQRLNPYQLTLAAILRIRSVHYAYPEEGRAYYVLGSCMLL